jgi:hypothetical protein
MKTAAIALLSASLSVAAAGLPQLPIVVNFDEDKPDHPPQGFLLAAMRQPGSGQWLVHRQGSNGYLAHQADNYTGYALAIHMSAAPFDLVAAVRMRLAGGAKTGGLVWHYQDERNYAAAILNLARREVSLYRMAAGNRIRTECQDRLELDNEAWHTMKIEHMGNETRVSLGGIRVCSDDHRRREGAGGGRVGLIADGDSAVWFDDLTIDTPKRKN